MVQLEIEAAKTILPKYYPEASTYTDDDIKGYLKAEIDLLYRNPLNDDVTEDGIPGWLDLIVNVKLICGYKKIDENIFIICFWVCVNAFNLQPVNLLFLFPEFGKRRSIQIQPLSVFGIGKLVLAIGAFIFALVKGSALTVFSL